MFSQLMSINRLLLLFSFVFFVISGADRVVRAADVTITPSDLMPTEAAPDATPAVEAKSAQQKVKEKIMAAGPGDTVSFPAGSYKDVGEILIATGGEPADNPETETDEGDGPLVFQGNGTTFTGKIMFNVKAAHVVIKGFTFMNTLVPDTVTIKADGDDSVMYGFPGVTVEDFLKDEGRVGDSYDDGLMPTSANVNNHGNLENNAELWVVTVDDDGATTNDIANKGTAAIVTGSGVGPYAVWGEGITSAKAKNSFGTVWVDSVIHSGTCRMSSGTGDNSVDIQIAGVVVRENEFRATELTGVRAGSFNPLAGTDQCNAQVDVIGNTFMNIGGNTDDEIDGIFAKNSREVFLRDGDMNMIADIGNREPAIDMMGVRAAMITDNTLGMAGEGDDPSVPPGTSDAIAVRGAPPKAAIDISNNRITSPMLNGILISDSEVETEAANEARITVSGNVISGTNANRYLTATVTPGNGASEYTLEGGNNDPVVDSYASERNRDCYKTHEGAYNLAAIQEHNKRLAPQVWRSRIDPFFGNSGAPRSLLDSDGSFISPVGRTDLVRYRADICFYLGSVKVVGQEGVRVTNNDLGWTADGGTYSRDALDYGVVVERGRDGTQGNSKTGDPVELKAFKGNNIAFHTTAPVWNAEGEGKVLSVAGNYFGGRPVSSSQITGNTEDAPIGPTDEDPRVVGPREDFINPDLMPPTLISAVVNEDGTMLTLTYNEDLDEDSTPSASAFEVRKSPSVGRSDPITVNGVDVDGNTVVLTLATSPNKIEKGDTVTVTYAMPSGTAARIQDMAGNPNPALSIATSPTVTNNVGEDGDEDRDMQQPGSAAGGGDGGCALASAGDDAINLGMLLLLTAAPFAFARRRRKAEESCWSGV